MTDHSTPQQDSGIAPDVDDYLDELVTGHPDHERPELDPADEAIVAEWEEELGEAEAYPESDAGTIEGDEERNADGRAQSALNGAHERLSALSGEAQALIATGASGLTTRASKASESLRQRTAIDPVAGIDQAGLAPIVDDAGRLFGTTPGQVLKSSAALLKRRPVETVLVTVGLGFVLRYLVG